MVRGGATNSFSSGNAENIDMSLKLESSSFTMISKMVRGPSSPQKSVITLISVDADLSVYQGNTVPRSK